MSWIREVDAEPIEGYRLIQPLGSGGFGEVWKCEAPGGLFKAIKFVYGSLEDVDCVRAEQELKALNRIKEIRHVFVCSVERIDKVDGELVIVMELADRTLHDLCAECQSAGMIGIPRDDLLRYLGEAAEALDYMNEKHNLQHLDVKPRNLFLVGEHIKVADFGLVKHLESRSASGILGGVTPLYAPPETFVGKISKQSDQYSLAIVYQEMLTGQRPYIAKNVRLMAQQHLQGEPDLRPLPEAERPILARALAKNPEDRFTSCKEFIKELYKARVPVRATRTGAPSPQRPRTMAETLEDIQLESVQRGIEDSELGVTPQPQREDGGVAVAEADGEEQNPDLGITVAQQDTGVLRPTLIIGVGSFGRKALLELRCRFLDRFGDLSKLPLLRFLCLDPDPDAANTAILGAPEVALTRNEFYPLPLQQVVNYRRRNLEHLAEWLPREKLYAMPRSLQTQGSRALGRLSFTENQQRVVARIRREIQDISKPEAIYESVNQTSLSLCNNTPRVYVIAAAGGGGSGLLPDLGYAIRRLLANLRHSDAKVTCFLLGGALQDPATPKAELANVYATLTELNHYSDPTTTFAAQYGAEGQRLVDHGAPYNALYLLPLPHRSPQSLDESVAHLGSYLFHELTTPVGLRLDHLRAAGECSESGPSADGLALPVRSFGTYAVWFPRGLLLHLAGRQACRRLIENWAAAENVELASEVLTGIDIAVRTYADNRDLSPEALGARIESLTHAGTPTDTGNTPAEVLAGILAKLEEQALQPVAQTDPANWAKQALNRVRDWVGTGGESQELNDWRKTKLAKALLGAAQKVAEDWDQQIGKHTLDLMGHSGARVAAAELALDRLQKFFADAARRQTEKLGEYAAQGLLAHRQAEAAVHECATGGSGFLFFMGKSKCRQLRHFMDLLAAFAHARLREELAIAARQCLANLAGRLAERLRDLGFCRQRLRHLQQNLEQGSADAEEELAGTRPTADFTLSRSPLPAIDSFWAVIRQSTTARVVLPEGAEDLEQAALRFLQELPADFWPKLDKELHDLVLQPRGGLYAACIASGDLTRQLSVPLLEEAGKFLGRELPVMDVAQLLTSEAGGESGGEGGDPAFLQEMTREYLRRATPQLPAKDGQRQDTFLLIPASPAGRQLSEAVATLFPDIKIVRVPGQSDLMFLREQGMLRTSELQALLRTSRAAYEAAANAPTSSPHGRFDVTDWLPLDP